MTQKVSRKSEMVAWEKLQNLVHFIWNDPFEKLILEHLMDFFNKHDIIYKHQFGFQMGESLLNMQFLTSYITNHISVGNKKKACSIKAFDTMNHDILLSKLEYMVWSTRSFWELSGKK